METTRMPGLGQTVLYRLTRADADFITEQRKRSELAAAQWPNLIHYSGSDVAEGQQFAADVVRVRSVDPADEIGLQVRLDGSDLHWVQRATEGPGPGCWSWPDF